MKMKSWSLKVTFLVVCGLMFLAPLDCGAEEPSITNSVRLETGGTAVSNAPATKVTISVPEAGAAELELAALSRTMTNQLEAVAHAAGASGHSGGNSTFILMTSAVLLLILFVTVKLGPTMVSLAGNARFIPWIPVPGRGVLPPDLAAEEKSFTEFAAAFRVGPKAAAAAETAARAVAAATATPETKENEPKPAKSLSMKEFLDLAPKRLGPLRTFLKELGQVTGEMARQKILGELSGQLRLIKSETTDPSLLPIWQMASALESLLRQLTERGNCVTPSTLRTVAHAVDLLGNLCVAGLKPDLLTNPPLRFLAVDDDPITRHTVSFALKRALNAPDLAENGRGGLALAEQQAYDVILLDIQMPGMDGFEVCSKIHATAANKTTPVVFVTCQSDFDSRAKSTLAGGCDLIGKPFLTFEITVKALTLALRKRLNGK